MKNDIENPKDGETEYQRLNQIISDGKKITGSDTSIRNVEAVNSNIETKNQTDFIEVTLNERHVKSKSLSSSINLQYSAAKVKAQKMKTKVKVTAKKVKNTKPGKQVSSFVKDFKLFISKGSVIDLAVGIIIGSAMSAMVQSMVNDIIGPVLGLLINNTLENSYFLLAWYVNF